MKKILTIIFSLAMAILIVYGYPRLVKATNESKADFRNEVSLLSQRIEGYSNSENTYYKLYSDGRLLAVVTDKNKLDESFEELKNIYSEDFPDSELGLKDNLYLAEEKTYAIFENIDDKIIDYLVDNDMLGIKAESIEFSDENGIYDIIYVDDIEDFKEARDLFLTNFISEDVLNKLRNNEAIDDINDFGTIEKSIRIREKIEYSDSVVSPSEIFKTVDEIYEYLCYGRNKERRYYTIQEGDTLNGIGFFCGDLSAKQIVSLNRNVISSVDAILKPGTVINVTYFESPITVEVKKQRLVQETITPASPTYIQDESFPAGQFDTIQTELVGLKNVLYEETWINGVVQSGDVQSSVTIREPVSGIIRVGTGVIERVGTGNFMWPVNNITITCGWGCYTVPSFHNGTDIADRYNRYGYIYAADGGTVEKANYDDISGNYVVINHNNGFKTYYGHMNTPAYVSVGESVERGQLIGQIGMTGVATGPHVHFMIYVDEVIVNVCSIMDCHNLN